MARRELVIHLAHGEPRLHLWCDRCLTSARYEMDLLRLGDDGVSVMGTFTRCHRCDDDA